MYKIVSRYVKYDTFRIRTYFHPPDAIPYVKCRVSTDAKLTTFDIPEDDFIHNLRILFVFYKTGSNLNQGRIRQTFVHKELIKT
jgi:hypothetical protein